MKSWLAAGALIMTIGCGGGSPNSPSSAASTALSHRAPVTVRVMTFNIQHGIDANGRYNLQRAISAIALAQPDIVGLQEVTRNHPSYACDDQPERIASGLRTATGQSWTVTYQQEWFTADTSCQASGRGTGPETEGLVLLTRSVMSGPTFASLTDSRIGLQVAMPTAYSLPVVVTHLTSGGAEAATRAQQVTRLTGWALGFGEPRIVMGDFNVGPQGPELQPFLTNYHDAWVDGLQAGRAIGAGNTKGALRVDYIFYVPGGSLTLESTQVMDTAVGGVQASDHQPVVANFTVR
jgi:endonuclease/exonuclease/phosphatase family metal-dependent hydrolase